MMPIIPTPFLLLTKTVCFGISKIDYTSSQMTEEILKPADSITNEVGGSIILGRKINEIFYNIKSEYICEGVVSLKTHNFFNILHKRSD